MNLKKLILTENECYKTGRKIKPKGIMVHSTGANNPYLRRYVGPDDGLLGRTSTIIIGTNIDPAADKFVSMPLSENLKMVPSLPIKPCHGIIEAGMQEVTPTTVISDLKSVKTTYLIQPTSMQFIRKLRSFARIFVNSIT